MKKFLIKLGITLALINLALTINIGFSETTIADQNLTGTPVNVQSPQKWLQTVGGDVKRGDKQILEDFELSGAHPDAPPGFEKGVTAVTSPILFLIDFLRYLMGGIAFLVVVISAIKLMTDATEEEMKKAKSTMIIGIVGLLVIQMASPLVKKMFFGEMGDAFENIAVAEMYAKESLSYIRGIIGLLHIFLGAIAVLVIIIRGVKVITSAGEEEELTKAKKHVLYALAGIAVIGLSELIVRGFVFPKEGEILPDVNVGRKLIVDITNYLSGFIAIICFVVLFYAGYRYVLSGGEEQSTEKVKKLVTSAVIGLVIALAAFAIVNTFLDIGAPIPVGK